MTLKRIHINQHVIKANAKSGDRNPVITVKTSKSNEYAHAVHIWAVAQSYTVLTNHYHVVLKSG